MSPLEARIRGALGDESMTAFVKRIKISRGTLYAAFKREAQTGESALDKTTAERIAAGLERPISWVYSGETMDERQQRPPSAKEADPVTEDAMRWRALCELHEIDEDVFDSFQVLSTIQFDRSKRAPTWGDFFSIARRRLDAAKETKPRKS